jgi:catechol 2,3-dioxygenase-like lactoylglutathione lyase family enzyme
MTRPQPPRLERVLETVLYYEDQDRAEHFYREVLNMKLLSREDGRHLFFRAGSSVFLLFDPKATIRGGRQIPHGAIGPGHTCFLVSTEEFTRWREHLKGNGVDILKDIDWPRSKDLPDEQASSFYFHDSEGNVLEIANKDFWPAS